MDFNQNLFADEASQPADRVQIIYYTDPLCCWSWALEPHWQRLLDENADLITYSYCMGGMIPDWQTFNDPINSVSRPVQMGPVWMEAKHLTGIGMDDSIWIKDPPSSSYPACIAVKAAALQSLAAEEILLKRIRKAVMVESKNVARADVLSDLARQTGQQYPEVFDFGRFSTDYESEASRHSFRNDLAKVRYMQIGRFPTITMTQPGGKSLIITGYRPYEVLQEALRASLPVASVT